MAGNAFALGGLGSGEVIVLILFSLVFGAFFLMLSFRILERYTPFFGNALLTMFASFAALVLIDFVLGLALRHIPDVGVPLLWVINLAVMFWIVKLTQRRPDGRSLTYVRASVITLGSFVFEFVVLVLVWLIIHYAIRPELAGAVHLRAVGSRLNP
ncbi:hypothetical protein [Metallibacterium sp.]|jgi:hypothetical protein|uniref:hypothetical protein n=1 Tax=Metallibacterium sp. TaxID=2940281 RepID=UPI002602D466|nr:hypothetical protein [Metallibacterium sp.]